MHITLFKSHVWRDHSRHFGSIAVVMAFAALLGAVQPAMAKFQGHPLVATPSSSVLLIVGDALVVDEAGHGVAGSPTDHQIRGHLQGRFQVRTVVDSDLAAEDLHTADAVVLAASTSAEHFQPFMLKASVPIVALKASSWTALGLAPFEDGLTPLQDLSAMQLNNSDHPIVNGLENELQPFAEGVSAMVGQAWSAESIPENGPQVIGNGPDGPALFVYEPGDVLGFSIVDDNDVAPSCRVGFPSHGTTLFSAAGLDLLHRALVWASSTACKPTRPGLPSTPSSNASMCAVEPADESRALVDGAFVDVEDDGKPNLSSLWVRALVHDAESDVLYVGGRFSQVYDAADRDSLTGMLGEGHRREGLFACDLATGTVTDFQAPLTIDPLGITDSGSLRTDRIRALAIDGEHLYIGGRFALDGDLEVPADFPLRSSGVVNLVRVDRATGEIDFDWAVDVRGGVSALEMHDGWLYVAGGIHSGSFDGDVRPVSRLIRIDVVTGTIDPTFTPLVIPTAKQDNGGLFASVSALAIHDDRLFVGGSFERIVPVPTTEDWRTYLLSVVAQPPIAWPDDVPAGEPRNSVASFDLAAPGASLTPFAPSLGDNNLAGGDVTAQIRDLAVDGRGSIFVCGDWWVTHPEPGLTWTPYDADSVREVDDLQGNEADVELADADADADADDADDLVPAEIANPDPNDPGWEGQRSLHQPRPNQHNIGKFDLITGASALTNGGSVWGATTDGGIQACDHDAATNTLIIGGHHESIGAFDPDFVDDPDSEAYPASHRPLEKVNAIDGHTGLVLDWDPDLNSARGVDAVLVIPGASPDDARIVVGGAFDSADRVPREGLALFGQRTVAPQFVEHRIAGGLQPPVG